MDADAARDWYEEVKQLADDAVYRATFHILMTAVKPGMRPLGLANAIILSREEPWAAVRAIKSDERVAHVVFCPN